MDAKRVSATGLLMLLFVSGSACRSGRTDPTGIILVGSPEISTRERLVNDRLTQDRWLREQLAASDDVTFDDFQGLLDDRTLTALSINASVNADPNQLALYNAESASRLQSLEQANKQSALDHEIQMLEKQKRIAELRQSVDQSNAQDATNGTNGGQQGNGGSNTNTNTNTNTNNNAQSSSNGPARPSAPAADLAGDLLSRLAGQRAPLPDPNHLVTTKAKATPIETLRDHLAYREEIRNEILENQLDDRHDLAGNTLYRLNLDSTLIPSARNGAWALVDVEVEHFDNRPASVLYDEWLRSFRIQFEREVASQFSRVLRCMGGDLTASSLPTTKCGLDPREFDEVRAYGRETALILEATKNSPFGSTRFFQQIYGRNDREQAKLDLRATLERLVAAQCPNSTVDKTLLERGLAQIIAVKLNREYFEQGQMSLYAPAPTIARPCDATRMVSWPKETDASETSQRVNQLQDALNAAKHVYAYSATPKDSVQRISRVAAARNTIELAAAISALAGSASIDTAMAFIRDNQRLMQTILREPLVVGYTEGGEGSSKAKFGWLVGPRFDLQKKFLGGEAVAMDHRPIQNSLAAAISLPGWSKGATVTVKTCWKSKESIQGSSAERCAASQQFDTRVHRVELPGRIEAINDLLMNRANPVPVGWQEYEVVSGAPASLLIKGANLWRSTEVTLGAQTADEIRVLPDMAGIIARFQTVTERAGLDESAPRNVDVYIWTSGGNQQVGEAKVYPPRKTEAAWKLAWAQTRGIKDEEVSFQVLDGTLPTSFSDMDLVIEGYDPTQAKWTEPIRLNATTRGRFVSAKLATGTVLTNGMELRGSVWVHLRPDSTAVDVKSAAAGAAIFYATAGDAKIQSPANLKSGGKLTLTFPKRVAQAYPGFGQPVLSLETTPAAAGLTATHTPPKWMKNADGQEVLETTVTITGAIVPANNPKLVVKLTPLPEGLVLDKDKSEIPLVQ